MGSLKTNLFSSLLFSSLLKPAPSAVSYKTSPTINIRRASSHPHHLPLPSPPSLLSQPWLCCPGCSLVQTQTSLTLWPSVSCQVTMSIYLCTVWYLSCGVCVCALVARLPVQVCFSRSTSQYQSLEPLRPHPPTHHHHHHHHHHTSNPSLSQPLPPLAASTWEYAQQSYCPTHSKMQHGT